MSIVMPRLRALAVMPRLRALAVAAVVGGAAFLSTPAQAWWRGGFFIGLPPVVVAPGPVYYPYAYPPAYYPPAYYPPAYYAPPYPYSPAVAAPATHSQADGHTQVAYGAMCYAGIYHCVAPAKTPVGQTCSCPGLGAPSFGVAQ